MAPKPIARSTRAPLPKKLTSTGKLPKLEDLKNRPAEQQKPEQETEQLEERPSDPFTYEQLEQVWSTFAESRKAKGRDADYTVLKQDFELKDDFVICLKLTNAVKINILDKFRSELVGYLKKELNNYAIVLETELLQEEEKKMIYTNKEKFEHLAEKKPLLREMQQRLGLDPDF